MTWSCYLAARTLREPAGPAVSPDDHRLRLRMAFEFGTGAPGNGLLDQRPAADRNSARITRDEGLARVYGIHTFRLIAAARIHTPVSAHSAAKGPHTKGARRSSRNVAIEIWRYAVKQTVERGTSCATGCRRRAHRSSRKHCSRCSVGGGARARRSIWLCASRQSCARCPAHRFCRTGVLVGHHSWTGASDQSRFAFWPLARHWRRWPILCQCRR